jgi:hypothetical protein
MDYYNTEEEQRQAIYINKLEAALEECNNFTLKEDRRYIIEVANVIAKNKEHGFTKSELKEINKQLIELI